MNERHDEQLDRLLAGAAAAQRFEPPPEGLAQRIDSKLQARQRRRRAGLALAAMLVLGGAASLHFYPVTGNQAQPTTVAQASHSSTPPAPQVHVEVGGDMLAEPIHSDNPNVTVLWLYPVVKGPQTGPPARLNHANHALNKEIS